MEVFIQLFGSLHAWSSARSIYCAMDFPFVSALPQLLQGGAEGPWALVQPVEVLHHQGAEAGGFQIHAQIEASSSREPKSSWWPASQRGWPGRWAAPSPAGGQGSRQRAGPGRPRLSGTAASPPAPRASAAAGRRCPAPGEGPYPPQSGWAASGRCPWRCAGGCRG